MHNFTTKTLVGFSIIGKMNMSNVAFLLMGQYDLEMKCAFFYTHMKKPPTSLEDLEVPEVLETLERFKDMYRKDVQMIFAQAAKEDKHQLLDSLKNTNKPHEMGTVTEIALKYNVSKSEVRRRKLEGTLAELAV